MAGPQSNRSEEVQRNANIIEGEGAALQRQAMQLLDRLQSLLTESASDKEAMQNALAALQSDLNSMDNSTVVSQMLTLRKEAL